MGYRLVGFGRRVHRNLFLRHALNNLCTGLDVRFEPCIFEPSKRSEPLESEMRKFTFRKNDGTTFTVQAVDAAEAMIKAQSQHDQSEADKRQAAK